MQSDSIQNIAVVGAGGQIGSYITSALLSQGKHRVTAITRPDSSNVLPPGLHAVIKAAYTDHAALVSALKGQHALIITMRAMTAPENQYRLIDAAIEAGVQYIMPNEYGADIGHPTLADDVSFGPAVRSVRKYIEEKGAGKTHWIGLTCGFWYEFSLAGTEARYGFDFDEKSVTLFDDGNAKICTSTWEQCGRAVAKLFALKVKPGEGDGKEVVTLSRFEDSAVTIKSFTVSQRDMLASVLRVTGDKEGDWSVKHEGSRERYERGKEMFKKGDLVGFGIQLYTRVFFPNGGGDFSGSVVNEQLGLPEENLDNATRTAIRFHQDATISSRDPLSK